MSDEEKKAIEKLSSKKNETTWNDTIRQIKREEIKDVVVTRQKYITLVLNLIEKQSKEIKDNKKYIDLHYVPYEQYISKLNELNKKWEDKIKAKIEELEKLNDESIGIGYWFAIYYLESLLEKE